MAYIYIIKCNNESLYTGIAKDIKARMKQHVKGTAAKYTRSKKIKELCALWSCENYSDAGKLEYAIKQLTRAQKQELISGGDFPNKISEKLDTTLYCREEVFDITDIADDCEKEKAD